jgi:hypothetical protein
VVLEPKNLITSFKRFWLGIHLKDLGKKEVKDRPEPNFQLSVFPSKHGACH